MDRGVGTQPFPSFLQSPEWEVIQRAVGRCTFRVAGILMIVHPLPRGYEYLYCPHLAAETREFESSLVSLARDRGSIFVKIDHWGEEAFDAPYALRSRSIQPVETVMVDLRQQEKEILAAMHQKTRYNIRLAERKGVSVSELMGGLGTLWSLLEETAFREGFRLHPREYYEALLSQNSRDFSNRVFVAHRAGKPLAAALVNFYTPSGVTTYLHGGSSRDEAHAMAPYLLQWEIIREAKRWGYSTYDLWGVDERRWPGITRFKKGFGGTVVRHARSVDVVFRPVPYILYRLGRWFAQR